MLFDKQRLQEGEACPEVSNVTWDWNPFLIMLKQSISSYFQLSIFECPHSFHAFFIIAINYTRIPALKFDYQIN